MPSAPPALTHDINRVLLAGALADAPDLYDLSPGPIVCFLRLRCDRHSSPPLLGEDGQLDVNVLLLGTSAANIAPHLYAGRRLVVDGALASAEWESTGAEPHETVCVLAQRVEFLSRGSHSTHGGTHLACSEELPDTAAMVGFSEDAWS
jgi:single-stranded DNA-binding protein